MNRPAALISGAGVAGPTLAWGLARAGWAVTVVERARDLRSSGNPVDVRGAALQVAERMGVLDALRRSGTRVRAVQLVDGAGRQLARIPTASRREAERQVEIPRGVLASVLYEAARDDAEFLFDESVVALAQDGDGVEVAFERDAPRRFDVVIGADGLHSAVRRLAFGPEDDFLRHMGLYVATVFLAESTPVSRDVQMYNRPGRALAVHPVLGRPTVAFMFRSPVVPGFDHRDTAQHRRLLVAAFAGGGWRTPELLDRACSAPDLFFDAVAEVRLPAWSVGRIALVGDSAAAASFLGDGSSLAMAGAATLAEELAADPGDPAAALRRYEVRHRRRTDPVQRAATRGSRLLVPATAGGIAARNAVARLWSATGGAAQALLARGNAAA
ncbi:FAD-dependent monooxygenase [Pseudonocardia lacus]|uniref:FAD-dependent monooxygenase n=1 Tax=Pseudonocardia lacus TaxID=2835865 RepID=UPI001BDDB6F1|nr:FAD-dependent monooxygenase [Pseudonocardia lacus]